MKWSEKAPSYGDIIRVKVKFYYHYGIFADENTVIQFGMPDNGDTPPEEIAVLTTSIDVFSGGAFIECATPEKAEKKRRHSPQKTVALATARIGERGYHILDNNCEHFANECYFGEKKSFLDEVRSKIRKKLDA